MKMQNLSAISCQILETVIVGYCGAYAHTKQSGQNYYNVPKDVTPDKCWEMAREEKVELGGKTFKIKMNKVNYVKAFTHGGIWYTGTNIKCVGKAIHLAIGQQLSMPYVILTSRLKLFV